MSYYTRMEGNGDKGNRLLSGSDDSAPAVDLPDHFRSSSSSSTSSSFLCCSPELQQRLFPPTVAARVAWLTLLLLLIAALLYVGYLIRGLTSSGGGESPSLPPSPQSTVILISIDGFRASYLDTFASSLPTMLSLRYGGGSAGLMRSCYPSTTFPNHWSIVTGLYPAQHGIVSNSMFDPVMNASFSMQTTASAWWGGEPVWNTAMRQGKKANVLFWPGSSVEVQGMRPNVWSDYNGSYPNPQRISDVLGWLDAKSCQLCISYFDIVDHDGHSYGPDSPQVAATLKRMDDLIAQLISGIYARNLSQHVTLLLVSDHGMAAIDGRSRGVALDRFTNTSRFRLIDSGATLGLWPHDPKDTDSIVSDLRDRSPQLAVYSAADFPAALHYSGNRRIPPVLGLVQDGWVVYASASRPYSGGGTHGYDPSVPSMGALFLGWGAGLARGITLDSVDNINVYSLICHLLGITPATTSGSLEPWRRILV